MRLISAAEIPELLPMDQLIPLMGEAFCLISTQQAWVAKRQVLELASGTGLLMGAALDTKGIAAKLVSVMPANLEHNLPGSIGLVLLMDAGNGSPLALMDGTCLTAIRTAALNAFAIDLLSRPQSRTALLVGCGTQAAAQLLGLSSVRQLEEIRVMGRDELRTEAFVDHNQSLLEAKLLVFIDPLIAMQDVDIIVAATNSHGPVLPGRLVPTGCHVSGIGSFKRGMCEFDNEILSKASIFVENRLSASIEAGELISAMEAGTTRVEAWTEIGEVLSGLRPGRESEAEITFFKSVGHSVFDLLAAHAVWRTATEQDIGTVWQP